MRREGRIAGAAVAATLLVGAAATFAARAANGICVIAASLRAAAAASTAAIRQRGIGRRAARGGLADSVSAAIAALA